MKQDSRGEQVKKRKMIGMLVGDPCGSYQTKFLEGALKILFENDMDAAIVSTFGKRSMSRENIGGEEEILNMINPDKADAVIIAPDTLVLDTDQLEKFLVNLKKRFRKPIVCADYDYSGFNVINTDDTLGMQLLTDHFIEVHEKKDIMYISGPLEHPHSQMRLKGFRNSLEAHGMTFDMASVFEGDFWYTTGEKFYSFLTESGRKLPDSIICANEPMALSVIAALEKVGYQIPDNVAVAGFDSDDDEIYNKDILTSCRRDSYTTGQKSALEICRLLGTEPSHTEVNDSSASLCIGKTCGCTSRNIFSGNYTSIGIESCASFQNLRSDYNYMLEDLVFRHDIEDFMWAINWYISEVNNFDRFTICINDNIFSQDPEFDRTTYSDRMIIAYDRDNSKENAVVGLDNCFDRSIMLPELDAEREVPSAFYFSPFHSHERCFGYMVAEYRNRPAVYHRDFRLWRRHVNVSFESLRRFMEMKATIENNNKLSDEMRRTQEELILAFAEITESKSGQTGQHVKRVSEYSKVLGEAAGLSKDDVEILRTASMMHDIGKLTISPEILEKPGKLTEDEFKIIKTHVTAGERMLHKSPGRIMEAARTIALEHHEKWNGTGYLRKKGQDIDLFSRIVAVADVYDALVSRRSYKEPYSERRAYEIILEDSGKHFDPNIVEAFVQSYDKILAVLERHPDCQ